MRTRADFTLCTHRKGSRADMKRVHKQATDLHRMCVECQVWDVMRTSPTWSSSVSEPPQETRARGAPPVSQTDSARPTPTPPHVRCPICVRAARTHARRSPKNALRLEVHDGSTHPVSHATPHPCSLLAMQPLPCSLLAVPLDPPVTFSTSHAAAAMQPAMLWEPCN